MVEGVLEKSTRIRNLQAKVDGHSAQLHHITQTQDQMAYDMSGLKKDSTNIPRNSEASTVT